MYSSKEEDLTPLPSTSETMESVRPCPKAEATFCGQVTNSWMNEILEIGYKRPLEKSDLYALREPFLTSSTKKDLSIAWQNRLIQSNKNRKPYKWPLIWSISDAFGTPFYLAGLMKFVGDAAAMASPYLLRILIRNIQTSTNQTENRQLAIMGYTICGAMFLLQLLNTLLVNYYFTTNSRVGLKVRTALNGMIYEKSLGLSGRARQQFSTGQQVNLMANDSSRVEMVAVYLHYIWSGPFQIIVIMSLLYRMIGISAFVGFFLFGIFIPIQSKITAWLSLYRKVAT